MLSLHLLRVMKDSSGKYIRNHVFTLEELDKLPKTRREAMVKGERLYFNGNLCKYNHLSPRRTDSKCRQCRNERDNARYKKITKGHTKRVRDLEKLTNLSKTQSRKEAIQNQDRYYLSKCKYCHDEKLHDTNVKGLRCLECIRELKANKGRNDYKPTPKKKETYNTIENILFMSAQARAKKKKLEFSIEYEDVYIPEICPILGIKINKFLEDTSQSNESRASSPSLDRVDSSKGYIKGNIVVISYRANVVKGQGTAEQHRMIAKWIRENT